METMRSYYDHDAKRVYYLSLEFLLGRALTNSMLNIGFFDTCKQALQELGMDFEQIRDLEFDYKMGKISSDDYEALHKAAVNEGLSIIKATKGKTVLRSYSKSKQTVKILKVD